MIISLIITALLLYVIFNTKYNGDRLPNWVIWSVALLTLASWESALVMLGISIYCLYNGIKLGEISTFKWIENLVK